MSNHLDALALHLLVARVSRVFAAAVLRAIPVQIEVFNGRLLSVIWTLFF